jgi:hypothetical protein
MTIERNTSLRNLAGLVLLACFIATLAISARHNHLEATGCQRSACMFCAGALAAEPHPQPILAAAPVEWEPTKEAPTKPALPYLLRLEHSGGAPPDRGC